MSNSSLPIFSLPMPISSLPSFLYPCPTPPCAVIYANASLLIAFSLSISSLSIPSLPSSPCPGPSPYCQSPHCPLILGHLSSFSWSVSMHISTLPYYLIHTHLLGHANLISPVPVLNDANLDCFIQPTECGRFSQVSLCKMKWKKSHTFYFFSRKMKDHECQSSVKMESTSVNMRTVKWRLCMMLSKGEQEYQVRTCNR